MGYSEDSKDVRVDFFKPSGKWHTTEAFKWMQYEGTRDGEIILIHDYFQTMLLLKLQRSEKPGSIRLAGMWAVCLEPYHEHGAPLMTKVPGCYGCGLLVCKTIELCFTATRTSK